MEHSASCRMQRTSFNFGFLLLLESGEGSKQVSINRCQQRDEQLIELKICHIVPIHLGKIDT